jgi:hypothetical protein
MAGGGTTIIANRSWGWLIAFVIITPGIAYAVHRAGGACGWDYSARGGACRAVILLSLLAGGLGGGLAAVSAHRASQQRGWIGLAGAAAVVLLLGILGARRFAGYMRGGTAMDDRTCKFARETLPQCVEVVWSHADAETVRKAQPGCSADAQSIRLYEQCSMLTDCQQIVDCVAKTH